MIRQISLAMTMLVLVAASASAQRRVTGRVTDRATGEPLAAVSINVVGTLVGGNTTDDGRYGINIPAGATQLSVRRIGYRRQVVTLAAGQTEANVAMEKDVMKLDQVVVTGTATTIDRAHAATATQTIDAEQIARVPAQDLTNALQGKIVGARVNMNSGAPGGGGQIQIRGVTSLNGNGEPLYVVDGVLISNAQIASGANSISRASGTAPASSQDNVVNRLADVNPNDIESIEVLKSAAASAMYGSRATNGVVIITTKKGKAGAPRFNITQRVGSYSSLKLLSSRRFTDRQALLDAAGGAIGTAWINANIPVGAEIPFFDYQKDLYKSDAPSYETLASISGGTDNGATRYYVSGTNKYDDGTLLNTKARMQTLRLSVDQLFGTRWQVNVGANIVRTLASRGISNNDNTNTSPFYVFGYTPAVIDLNQRDPATGLFVRNPFANGGSFSSNPFETHTYIKNDEDVFRQIGNASVTFDAWNNTTNRVQLRGILGVDRFNQDDQVYAPNFLQFEARDALLGTATQSNALSRQWNSSINAVWTLSPSNGWFTATGTLGSGMENRYLNNYRIQARGLLPGVVISNTGTIALEHRITNVEDQFFFAQEEFLAWKERVNFTVGMRAERSSANGDRSKYFIYPKVAGSYRFTDPIPFVNNFKLRASMGMTGNQPDYGRRDLTLANGGTIDGRTSLAAASTLGNPEIEPEKLTEVEFGVDASFWDNRFGAEITRFDRTVKDMFLFVPLAPSTGTSSIIDNAGTMETEGWEVGVTLAPIRRAGLDWTSRVNYYKFAGKITELPVPAFISSSGFGTAYGRARAYCPGFNAAGQPTLSTLGKCGGTGTINGQSVTIEPGSLTAIWGNRYRCDADHRAASNCTLDSTFTDTIIGDATPDFEMSFANEMAWKRLSLSFLLDWRKGGEVSNMTQSLFDEGANSWDYDHPTPDAAIGATLGEYRYNKWNGGRNASIYIQDGSFVKLREITLSYDIPTAMVQRYVPRAADVRLSLSGRNLKQWTDYWGVDAEVNNFGNANVARQVDLAPFPTTKSWFLSVGVGF